MWRMRYPLTGPPWAQRLGPNLKRLSLISSLKSDIPVQDTLNLREAQRIKLKDLLNRVKVQQNSLLTLVRDTSVPKASITKTKPTRSVIGAHIDKAGYTVSSTLAAFTDACNIISNVPLAIKVFKAVHSSIHSNRRMVSLDISLYHLLLRCVARRGKLEELEYIWTCLENDKHVPDPRCYAALIQCISVRSKNENVFSNTFVKFRLEEMSRNGTTLDQIAQTEAFCQIQDDLQNFIDGAKLLDPSFEFFSRSPEQKYSDSCSLVKPLNKRKTDNLKSAVSGVLSLEELNQKLNIQLQSEYNGFVDIKPITEQSTLDSESFSNKLCEEWKLALIQSFKMQLNRLMKREKFTYNPRNVPVYPFFKVLNPEDYVDIMINEVSKVLVFSDNYSPNVSILQEELGREVMKKFQLKQKMNSEGFVEKMQLVFNEYFEWFTNPSSNSLNAWCHREALKKILCQNRGVGPNVFVGQPVVWPHGIRQAIGRELFFLITNELRVNLTTDGGLVIGGKAIHFYDDKMSVSDHATKGDTCPALYKLYRMRKDQRNTEELKPHPLLVKLFAPQKYSSFRFLSSELPMLVPAVPWLSPWNGGFLLDTATFVRVYDDHGTSPMEFLAMETKLSTAFPVFDALNQLGSIPWKINSRVLDLAIRVFTQQANKEFTKELLSTLSIPMNEEKLMQLEGRRLQEELSKVQSDSANYKILMDQRQAFQQMKQECSSLWCNTMYCLSIANAFRDEVVFFPHNIDFRGRVYPIPSHFNHMGNDLSRSLLVFAKGKPLGSSGLDWLKIHCVNLTGKKKKESLESRLKFANENLEAIINSANHPFENTENSWWLDSDDPWQTLAACMEIRDAINSQNPEEFVSHLPVHQDGSCNGLQHYAALGRDILGGRSVNILPSEKPQDVYSEIATIVNQKRAEDEKNGNPTATLLNGFVDRKVIKQTVMTTVYGVTHYGAKLQIAKQLKDNNRFPLEEVEKASKYLATKTFESLNELFTSSQQIQAWFTECANVISGTLTRNVEWETPIGLAVIQGYSKKSQQPRASSGKPELSSVPVLTQDFYSVSQPKPNSLKQRNGFPPNFVHSLDSTHMMLTSLYLWDAGITFASVHDCYWTHASNVMVMNKVCRDQFVALHSEPILENLSEFFVKKYLLDVDNLRPIGRKTPLSLTELAKAQILFTSIPKKGDLDLELVKDSVYFFS